METRRLVPSARIGVSCFHYSFFLLSLLAVKAAGLYLHNGATEVVSDGIGGRSRQGGSSFLRLKGTEYSNEYYCSDQMYGFLPCSSTLTGHLFLVMVYEYLLFQGESLTVSGGSRLFEILGPGVFGASAFPVIGPLPESLILLKQNEEDNKYVKDMCITMKKPFAYKSDKEPTKSQELESYVGSSLSMQIEIHPSDPSITKGNGKHLKRWKELAMEHQKKQIFCKLCGKYSNHDKKFVQ